MEVPASIRRIAQLLPNQPAFSKGYRSVRKSLRFLKRSVMRGITREQLAQDFRNIGLCEGDIVFAHSSLRRLGPVEGGAHTVIRALLDVVGPSGTLTMPAFTMNRSCTEYLASKPLFDPISTPSTMGKITETFRTWPGVKRSIHATHSICGIGPDVSNLLKDHFLSLTPFGRSTPFCRLYDLNAIILAIGIRILNFTMFHVHEDLTEDYPLPVYHKNPVETRVLVDGVERRVMTMVHNEALAPYRPDSDLGVREILWNWLVNHGYLRYGKTGNGVSCIITARDLFKAQELMFEEGLTMYNTPRMSREGWQLSDRLIKSYNSR